VAQQALYQVGNDRCSSPRCWKNWISNWG